jgi:hypothetical protein
VRVYDGPRLIARSPLVAARGIAAPNLPSRAGWYAKRAAHVVRGWLP